MRKFLCFAEGRDGAFEAICVDLDIAVQGKTFEEVYKTLNTAVASYIADALKEDEANGRRLLSRRAPWHVRAGLTLRFLRKVLGHPHDDGGPEASFEVACPA